MGVTLPVPDFEALRDVRVTLGAGSMLPDEQETREQREALRVNIQGPRALGARGDSQLLQQCALAGKTQEAIRERREGGDRCGCQAAVPSGRNQAPVSGPVCLETAESGSVSTATVSLKENANCNS